MCKVPFGGIVAFQFTKAVSPKRARTDPHYDGEEDEDEDEEEAEATTYFGGNAYEDNMHIERVVGLLRGRRSLMTATDGDPFYGYESDDGFIVADDED